MFFIVIAAGGGFLLLFFFYIEVSLSVPGITVSDTFVWELLPTFALWPFSRENLTSSPMGFY